MWGKLPDGLCVVLGVSVFMGLGSGGGIGVMSMGFLTSRTRAGRVLGLAVSVACTLVLALAVGIAGASGGFGVSSFTMGTSSSQAGGHVDFTTSFAFGREALGGPAGQVKNVTVVLPEGLVGDPQDIPRCSVAELVDIRLPALSAGGCAHEQVLVSGGRTGWGTV